ncbi:MAG: hypothetical protein HY456_00320 [Parcubacteria group bacterium]|nr:hypothetical protein [Parcubacteria group bacterium]
MENEIQNQKTKDYLLPASILISALAVAGSYVYVTGLKVSGVPQTINTSGPEEAVLPVRWGDLGAKMINAGVIDGERFESLYAGRDETRSLLYGENNGNIKITSGNSGMILNLLWALGLGAKNDILERGEMANPRYGGAGNFASTGGWTLAEGDAMNHYSRHPFIVLTSEQQKLVERISKNIYRPCCDNPTYFPDCNHGMAMLGLLELMASQGVSEEEMYRTALVVNSYWFPEEYENIKRYFESRGLDFAKADPKEVLGKDYSSASGYQRILSRITPPENRGGASCGV